MPPAPETKSLDELKPDPKNPRILSKHDGAALSNSITKFGDLSCIVFNTRTQQLVGGHQRIEIMKQLGEAGRIEITQRFETPDEVGTTAIGYVHIGNKQFAYREVDWDEGTQRAANIAANRIQGEFDKDLLGQVVYELSLLENGAALLSQTGLAEAELGKLLDGVGVGDPANSIDDEAPPVDDVSPAVSQSGEIYQLGAHRLMCADSTDFGSVTDLLNGQQPELMLTDPPYNMDYQGGGIFENHINQSFKDNIKPLVDFEPEQMFEIVETIKPRTSICFTSKDLLYKYLKYINDNNKNFNLLTWHKTNPIPMNNGNFLPDTEYIFYWYDQGQRKFNNGVEGLDYHKYYIGEINEGRREGENQHPTIKPLDLLTKFIKICSDRGDVVLDLFGGSGSTLIACEKTARTCAMMELDPKYVDVIRKRYAKQMGLEDWQAATPVINAAQTVSNEA